MMVNVGSRRSIDCERQGNYCTTIQVRKSHEFHEMPFDLEEGLNRMGININTEHRIPDPPCPD